MSEYHEVSILRVGKQEYSITCANELCPYTRTSRTKEGALTQALDHVRDLYKEPLDIVAQKE